LVYSARPMLRPNGYATMGYLAWVLQYKLYRRQRGAPLTRESSMLTTKILTVACWSFTFLAANIIGIAIGAVLHNLAN